MGFLGQSKELSVAGKRGEVSLREANGSSNISETYFIGESTGAVIRSLSSKNPITSIVGIA